MRPVLIFSGDRRQTESLAHILGMQPMKYRHVFDVNDLYGGPGVMMLWGTWGGRKDLDAIMDVARKLCLQMLYVDDGRTRNA